MVMEGLENGSLDAGILRDSDPAESIQVAAILTEPFVAVLPASHACARQKSISPASLRGDPFIYYPRSAGARAYEKPLTLCEEHGFRPQVVQEASNWLTILRLIGSGLGVTIAPACVRKIASAEVVCLPLRGARAVSNIELAWPTGESRPIVDRFRQIAMSTRAES
jgi:DNA-binding transcriptional LysR family regulator